MIGMVPGRLGQMADSVDDHQRPFPAVRLVGTADPAVLELPCRKIGCKPSLNVGIRHRFFALLRSSCSLLRFIGH